MNKDANDAKDAKDAKDVKNADQEKIDKDLFRAIRINSAQATIDALERGANINAWDTSDSMPIHLAIRKRNWKLVETLLDRGADVLAVDRWGHSVAHVAVLASDYSNQLVGADMEIFEILKNHGADMNAKNRDGKTALHLAASNDYGQISRVLLDCGAEVDAQDNRRRTPLVVARGSSYAAPALVLIAYGASKGILGDSKSGDDALAEALRMNPLQAAVSSHLIHKAVELLDAGWDPNERGESAQTPMEIAERRRMREMVDAFKAHASRELARSLMKSIDSGVQPQPS